MSLSPSASPSASPGGLEGTPATTNSNAANTQKNMNNETNIDSTQNNQNNQNQIQEKKEDGDEAPTTINTNPATNTSAAVTKRKPSRRANTAERRATHNAVERQRRETLNGRFLDLAALLPNLSQIRRPSKSSIVNSSIAHIHASRRHRILASRELRALKSEADALRREVNEWRDRSGLPRVEEPMRGEGFALVLSAEMDMGALANLGGEYGGEFGEFEGFGEGMYVEEGEEDEDEWGAPAGPGPAAGNGAAPGAPGSGPAALGMGGIPPVYGHHPHPHPHGHGHPHPQGPPHGHAPHPHHAPHQQHHSTHAHQNQHPNAHHTGSGAHGMYGPPGPMEEDMDDVRGTFGYNHYHHPGQHGHPQHHGHSSQGHHNGHSAAHNGHPQQQQQHQQQFGYGNAAMSMGMFTPPGTRDGLPPAGSASGSANGSASPAHSVHSVQSAHSAHAINGNANGNGAHSPHSIHSGYGGQSPHSIHSGHAGDATPPPLSAVSLSFSEGAQGKRGSASPRFGYEFDEKDGKGVNASSNGNGEERKKEDVVIVKGNGNVKSEAPGLVRRPSTANSSSYPSPPASSGAGSERRGPVGGPFGNNSVGMWNNSGNGNGNSMGNNNGMGGGMPGYGMHAQHHAHGHFAPHSPTGAMFPSMMGVPNMMNMGMGNVGGMNVNMGMGGMSGMGVNGMGGGMGVGVGVGGVDGFGMML